MWKVLEGDSLEVLRQFPADSFDAIVTDCPYALGEHRTEDIVEALSCWVRGEPYRPRRTSGFMGQEWDRFVPGPELWREALRVLKPGGALLTSAGARTQALVGIAVRLAGLRTVDGLAWLHAQGKPPSKKHCKPSFEPIVYGIKPGGVSYFDVEGCRIPSEGGRHRVGEPSQDRRYTDRGVTNFAQLPGPRGGDPAGRWPANVCHDGSDEVIAEFPESKGQLARARTDGTVQRCNVYSKGRHTRNLPEPRGDSGSAARFYFCAKATPTERAGSTHKTIKPVRLMRWLIRLVCPPGGRVLDPFSGSGSTGVAAVREDRDVVLIERDPTSVAGSRQGLEAGGLDP